MNDLIAVGVVDTPAGRRAVDWAVQRAADRRQRIELISIVGGVIGSVGAPELVMEALSAAQRHLDELAAGIAERGIPVTTFVDAGNPVAALIEASEHAALLVIGSDYRGPKFGPARGAHGLRVAAGAHCPAVVVPDIDITGRTGVVVGVDGSEVSERAIAFAAAEADRLREPLVAVAVWTPIAVPRNDTVIYPVQYLTNMQSLTEETLALSLAGLRQDYPDLEIVARAEQGYPSHVINEIATTARLTVMGSHGRGAVARFLLGSISHEVLARLATVTAIVR